MSYQILHTATRRLPSFPLIGFSRLILLAFCLLLPTACGKRPAKVDAPPSASDLSYPRTYPDIKTDPRP